MKQPRPLTHSKGAVPYHWPHPNFASASTAPTPIIVGALACAVLALAVLITQCYRTWQILQEAQSQKLSAQRLLDVARGQHKLSSPTLSPQAQSAALDQARKLVRGLRPSWSSFWIALEEVGSAELQWIGVDAQADSGAVRLSGHSQGLEPVLRAIVRLNLKKGWSQITLVRLNAPNSMDPAAPLQFDIQAQFVAQDLP